ncbi:hypothetical protein H8L32_16625 [Undibacterium sp. CY18W]|uniref:Uncharacterized protein n=1 Tax=Undibacterium hunanense TaxID=2762292 RepID=A0ABR6ZU93_9BURK|nr:hypothetical protein [Undibacterium hunanense]MBC3919118.1 hypothetical protein [Undibacterium hunanense]
MTIKFEPQFHKKMSQSGDHAVWVALPHPRTIIPVKAHYYRQWQFEEQLKIQGAGDVVLAFPVSQ